mmetsp:Transcript_81377/g.136206  ORF Transcript_81377/g.136206 Transcript_81377/m.136206 type:complete len:88 (-) Transcript_81377:484-747(-)
MLPQAAACSPLPCSQVFDQMARRLIFASAKNKIRTLVVMVPTHGCYRPNDGQEKPFMTGRQLLRHKAGTKMPLTFVPVHAFDPLVRS